MGSWGGQGCTQHLKPGWGTAPLSYCTLQGVAPPLPLPALQLQGQGSPGRERGDAATRCWWGSLLRFRHGSSPESGSAPSGLQATGRAAGMWPGARTRHPMKGSLGPGGQTASDLRGAGSP